MALSTAIIVLDSFTLMQGTADNAVSASDKDCSMADQSEAEEKSKISRLGKSHFLMFPVSQKSCLFVGR